MEEKLTNNRQSRPKTKEAQPRKQAQARVQTQSESLGLPSPEQMKKHLDRFVIGQDDAKMTLSVAIYNHYKRIILREKNGNCAVDKSNIILLGPTGCGKTLMVKTIAKMLDVPCYIQDSTKMTAAGYVGSDVEDCLVGLLRNCNYDIPRAQRGIVILDEIDKNATKGAGPSITRDVSGECVQQSLLKLVEGDTVGVMPAGGRRHPEAPLLYVDTTDILFIASGAFVGIDDIIARRLGTAANRIGFSTPDNAGSKEEGHNILADITPADLRQFGLIPEFVGRFPVTTYVNDLRREDLVRILQEPANSLVRQYTTLLEMDGCELSFEPAALDEIADLAIATGTGARGLRNITEKVMRDIMYSAPSMKGKKKHIVITREMVCEKNGKKLDQ